MVVKMDVKPKIIKLVPSANVFDLGQFSHCFFKTLRFYIEEKVIGNNVSNKRDAHLLNLSHFESSSATSFELDESTILSIWNGILYSGKNIVGKEEIA